MKLKFVTLGSALGSTTEMLCKSKSWGTLYKFEFRFVCVTMSSIV